MARVSLCRPKRSRQQGRLTSTRNVDPSGRPSVAIEQVVNILTVNLLLSTLVFWVAARIYILPKLPDLNPRSVLLPILLLHSLRHLGLMFLAPGAIYAGMPPRFAYLAAYGDLLAALLALAAIPVVASNARAGPL